MKVIVRSFLILWASSLTAQAQEYVPLAEYIKTVNNVEVTFSGAVRFDPSEKTFTFYNDEGDSFPLTMDAGRRAREEVQELCAKSGYFFSRSNLCTFSANGTIEIVGSRLQLKAYPVVPGFAGIG